MPTNVKELSNLALIIALFASNSSNIVSEYAQMWEEEEEEMKNDATATCYMEMLVEEYSNKKGFDKFQPACKYLAEVLGKPVYKYSAPTL